MKQLFKTKRGEITVADVPAPACGDGELLVETAFTLISAGTETKTLTEPPKARAARRRSLGKRGLEVLRADGPKALLDKVRSMDNLGEPLGYSASGIVVEVGRDVVGFAVGDRVACAGGGYASHAELIRVPPLLAARVPDGLPLQDACYTTLGAIAMQGVRRAAVHLGEVALVVGTGLIGALTIQLLRAAGCRVIAVDRLPERLELARKLGALTAIEAGDEVGLREALAQATGGLGADAVLLCATTPSNDPMRQAIAAVRQRGRVVVVGDVGMQVPRSPFYQKEAEVTISCSYGPGRYDPSYEEGGMDYPAGLVRWTENRNMDAFLRLAAEGAVDVRILTTHTFPIADGHAAYELLVAKPATTLGVLLRYPGALGPGAAEAGAKPDRRRTLRISPEPKFRAGGRIALAVVGVGGFARSVHLPNILQNDAFSLRFVVARTGATAAREARSFGAAFASTDWREAVSDSHVNAVVVCTRHDSHAAITAAALDAGKHVLVEKPLGLTEDEVSTVLAAHNKSGTVLSVGTNRRYSAPARLLRRTLAEIATPAFIVCRVNAGAIPASHWTQDREVGGGRVIGEVCHFLDLCGYLVGDAVPVRKVQASAIAPGRKGVASLDNVSIQIEYADGSLASILYTSLGPGELPKERVEVMAAGNAFVIDDFRSMKGYGPHAVSWSSKRQDKGHAAELSELAQAIRGLPSELVSASSSAATARLAIRVDAALRSAS